MKTPTAAGRTAVLRQLPSIDELLRSTTGKRLLPTTGPNHLAAIARAVMQDLRDEIAVRSTSNRVTKKGLLAEAERRLEAAHRSDRGSGIRRVLNATGVVIHTNLGRAPLSENARRAMLEEAAGYCTLEYDISEGKRGRRGERAEKLLSELTGAEAAVVVNNCAAAAFLVLTVLASGGEVIVSRGELVEIGGDFRIPDVLVQSGAVLREVGTTNRTKIADFEKAINENTRMLLRVHPSNYRIVGFTAMPEVKELAGLAERRGVILYEDAGSGALADLSMYGFQDEPVIADSIKAGAHVVTFSGDKLLGGPQSGLIVGKREIVERIRKHPLFRALRVDKITYAALEATLESFRKGSASTEIPTLEMISLTKQELDERTRSFADKFSGTDKLTIQIIDGNSAVGGGAAPAVQPETALLALEHENLSAAELERALRLSDPPVITRIMDDRVVVDLRTIPKSDQAILLDVIARVSQ